MGDDDVKREAQELSILTGALVRLSQRLHERAKALESELGGPLAARESSAPPDSGAPASDPLRPAVLMATNLAALGHSRDEIRAVLTESFDLDDPEPVLDEALSGS